MTMMRSATLVSFFFFLLGCCAAQTAKGPARVASKSPAGGVLSDVRASGSQRFQAADIVQASGLKPGGTASDAAYKEAADHLAATGVFSEVSYRYEPTARGMRVEFLVKDTAEMLPALFDNFVWLPRDELIRQLKTMEPLFDGEVPEAGEMYQRLASDVKTVLAKMNVQADVTVMPQSTPSGGKLLGFLYSVKGASIAIGSVQFAGAAAEMIDVLQRVAQSTLVGKDYSISAVDAAAKYDYLPQYRMRGFLQAEFGTPSGSLTPGANGVVVTLPVKEGICYQLSTLGWLGNTAFSSAELAKKISAAPGKPLNEPQLQEDLAAVSKLYRTQGYLEAHAQPNYQFNDSARTVAVNVAVAEGSQYHMGALTFEGLGESAANTLRKLWTLQPGAVYSSDYPNTFFQSAARQFDLRALKLSIAEHPQRSTKTVDVTVKVTPK